MEKKLLILLFILPILLISCSLNQENIQNEETSPEVTLEEIDEEPGNIDSIENARKEAGDMTIERYYGEFEVYFLNYPTFQNDETNKIISKFIKSQADIFLKDTVDALKNENWKSELYIDYEVWKDGNYYNVKLLGESFLSGDAHPTSFIKTFVLDKDFNILTVSDISEKDYTAYLKDILVRKYQNFKTTEEMESVDFSNFLVHGDTLDFYFNPYEVAPGNEGIVRVCFDPKGQNLSTEAPQQSFREDSSPKNNKPIDLKSIPKGKKYIALTFDDGPSKYTTKLLDILKENQSRATFFVLGVQIKGHESIIKRMASEGHAIGNHSYNHKQFTRLSNEDMKAQINSVNAMLNGILGFSPSLLRPPYGAFNDSVKKVAKDEDMAIILWDVDTLDWKHRDSKHVSKWIIDHSHDGAIVIMHDIYPSSVEGVQLAIKTLKSQGYELVTIPELMALKGQSIVEGQVYTNIK